MPTTTTHTALVVDDEADLCRLIQMMLARMNIKTDVAYDLATAYQLFDQNDYSFCLTDLALPDGSGIEFVKRVAQTKNTPIAVISAHGNEDLSVEAMKLGAFDFVNKPLGLTALKNLVDHALKSYHKHQNTLQSNTQLSAEDELLNKRLIGQSEPMDALRVTIKKVTRSQAPVFLWGESGTGKEVVARLIHDLSPRREGSFVPVNCGAIPSELMESEFFGHKKGSFTGATTDKIGLFQQANGGTLFLDEVADLPLSMQVKLLRAIQEKTVRAIGDTKEMPVDVRILSATHKDLNKLVQAGVFRQDLFYRINVIMVKLPTLNERREDIELLAKHFLMLIAKDWDIKVPSLSEDAMQALIHHDFEGNVRELRNLLERAVTMSEEGHILTQHLFAHSIPSIETPKNDSYHDHRYPTNLLSGIQPVTTSRVKVQMSYTGLSDHKSVNPDSLLAHEKVGDKIVSQKSTSDKDVAFNLGINEPAFDFDAKKSNEYDSPLPKEGLEAYLMNQERSLIIAALAQAGNNKTNAAKLLGMSFRSLRYRMKKLEIDELGYD